VLFGTAERSGGSYIATVPAKGVSDDIQTRATNLVLSVQQPNAHVSGHVLAIVIDAVAVDFLAAQVIVDAGRG
jgi:hypothetical protein